MLQTYDWRDELLFRLLSTRWVERKAPSRLGDEHAQAWLNHLVEHGMLGVVLRYHARALDAMGGAEWAAQVRLKYLQAAIRNTAVIKAAKDLCRVFSDRSIDWAVLKGPGLSAQLYNDPAIRASRDLDVLLNPAQFKTAINVLKGAGFSLVKHQSALEMHIMLNRRWPLIHECALISPNGVLVELHLRSDFSPQLGLGLSRIPASDRSTVLIDGIDLPCLTGASQLMQVSRHAYRSMWLRWKWLYDCIELAATRHMDLNAERGAIFDEWSFRVSLQLAAYLMKLPLAVVTDGKLLQADHNFDCDALLTLRDSKILKEERARAQSSERNDRLVDMSNGLKRIGFQMRAQGQMSGKLKYATWRSLVSVASAVFSQSGLTDERDGS